LAALLVFAGAAFADALTPESGGSPNADEIDSLYKLILAVAVIIFLGVEGALFYSLFKFRARKGLVAAQIRGNTRLEVGWTVGAALVLVVLAAFTFFKLDDIRNPPNSGPNCSWPTAARSSHRGRPRSCRPTVARSTSASTASSTSGATPTPTTAPTRR
jgi:heme/copper-type cytochrome/quinol oxidase subunit 2